MAPPNSTPGGENTTMDEEEAASPMEHPLSPASLFTGGGNRQPGIGADEQIDIDEAVSLVRDMEQNRDRSTNRLCSPDRSLSESTRGTEEVISDDSAPIEPYLYKLLVTGDKDRISSLEVNLCELKSREEKDTVLHVAAAAGQARLIADMLPNCKGIIKWQNCKGDLAFHSAAKAGQLNALKALTTWEKYDSEEGISNDLLGWGNEEGDTPLHIALENNQEEMARCLVDEFPDACWQLNEMKVSPLYMAVKAGYWGLVKHMISFTKNRKPESGLALLRGKSVVHATIAAKNLEILEEVLLNHDNLIESFDEEGRAPLSYAAFKGYLEGVQYLLKDFPSYAFKRDKDEGGSFPIHKANSGGHIKVIKELYQTKLLLNKKGQNILHVAAWSGKAKVVSYLLKIQELEQLINLKDDDGNTPLHLATKGFHPRVVYLLTRENRVKLQLQNKDGLTALDMAEIYAGIAGSSPTFEARLTWMALRYVNAPRSSQSTRKSYVRKEKQITEEEEYQKFRSKTKKNKENDKKELESYKDRVGTHLLVATLVATVTFAAGFTLPGGYYQDGHDIGMATLAHRRAFEAFVICNTAAMYSSILAVVTLIWAQMGDLKLILVSLRFALPVLGFSLSMMSVAFMMGIFVALRNQPWLAYVILGMGSIFLVVVLLFFIPLYNPSYIRNPLVRFFFSGTFLLLLLVCEKSKIEYA